ncbi:hypothetical protein COL26_20255 [Bacillus thuringiensis]|uniref:Uncharacterized protein n=1 Tax=Bacillus thuringiensis TaxID=1428 RepID=A0ABD6RZ29_BACTU|nr:hypothetical protein [Bacillus thuringiensis]PER45212.1 hypothetical protein CN495_27490 [Bacillus thuringiensis]PEU86733.1 hypothetical protein CN411_16530 [Bacillus thuringiensis]PFI05575.1 hypothetical protein COI79_25770 [Bacillus thuringiensis]PFW36214.1 hypothetical protein COL26_20255 [Bacillus thuringiensis]PGY80961.1 hypothetical protein COE44_07700 [Bacillus thuringiensis]
MQTLAILSISVVVTAGFMLLAKINYDLSSIRENPLPTVFIIVTLAIFSISLYNSGKDADHNLAVLALNSRDLEQKQIDDKNRLLETELGTTGDKLLVEDYKDYTKVTSEKGGFKVIFIRDMNDNMFIQKITPILTY